MLCLIEDAGPAMRGFSATQTRGAWLKERCRVTLSRDEVCCWSTERALPVRTRARDESRRRWCSQIGHRLTLHGRLVARTLEEPVDRGLRPGSVRDTLEGDRLAGQQGLVRRALQSVRLLVRLQKPDMNLLRFNCAREASAERLEALLARCSRLLGRLAKLTIQIQGYRGLHGHCDVVVGRLAGEHGQQMILAERGDPQLVARTYRWWAEGARAANRRQQAGRASDRAKDTLKLEPVS